MQIQLSGFRNEQLRQVMIYPEITALVGAAQSGQGEMFRFKSKVIQQARMSVKAQDNAAQTPQVCQLYEYQREQLVSAIKSTNLGIAIILFNALVKQVP